MAKPKKATKRRAKIPGKQPGTFIANHGYGGRKFRCYGKPVNKRGGGKVSRIFCARRTDE